MTKPDIRSKLYPPIALLCILITGCVTLETDEVKGFVPDSGPNGQTQELASTLSTSDATSSETETINPSCLNQFHRRELRKPYQQTGHDERYTLSSEELTGYLDIMGIEFMCIPVQLGAPFINADWSVLDGSATVGRMISIGFEDLYEGAGWSRGFLLYATYDFSAGTEYDVFSTQDDIGAVRNDSFNNMITVDKVPGFIRYHASLPMGMQYVSKTYVFPFETYYVAVVIRLGAYDPTEIGEVLREMENGTHPESNGESVLHMDALVSSIRFK